MEITGKGNDLGAGVQYDPADPAFAAGSRQGLQTAKIGAL
jgi:hypothetical protein